jgi:protein phosphatase
VGDSRIYRMRKGRLSRLTVDHTFVQDMIFEGEVDPTQARFHPFRHMLTRVVGTGEPLEWVDTRIDGLKTGDC